MKRTLYILDKLFLMMQHQEADTRPQFCRNLRNKLCRLLHVCQQGRPSVLQDLPGTHAYSRQNKALKDTAQWNNRQEHTEHHSVKSPRASARCAAGLTALWSMRKQHHLWGKFIKHIQHLHFKTLFSSYAAFQCSLWGMLLHRQFRNHPWRTHPICTTT